MTRCVLNSVLLLTTLLQSTQPCCAHAIPLQSTCCNSPSPSRCDHPGRTSDCSAETCPAALAVDGFRQPCASSRCVSSRPTPEVAPFHPVPTPDRHECPTCNGELPNPVTKTSELQFAPSPDQDTRPGNFPAVAQGSPGNSDAPAQRNHSRVRSPGHLLI